MYFISSSHFFLQIIDTSLLSCIGKMMERAVYKYTYNFIFEHSLLYAY